MITIVMAYYENGGMLDLHLAEWIQYADKDQWRIVLVDDCSKQDPALPHIRDVGFPVELYRITTDRPWNQNGARNLGMTHVNGWTLLTDMDHLLTLPMARRLQAFDLNPLSYYRPARVRYADNRPYKRHPNTYLLHSDDYWRAGGYDERYCGYYGTDSTFRRSLEKKLGPPVDLDIPLTLFGREVQSDASTRDLGRKGSEYHLRSLPHKGRELEPVPQLNFEWERLL